MDPLLTLAKSKQDELIGFLRELVECESPSDDPAAIERFTTLFTERVQGMAHHVRSIPAAGCGPVLQVEFRLDGCDPAAKPILALGHSDTVYPLGTLAAMPFRVENGRIWGPGTLDMKGGIAFFVFALRCLQQAGRKVRRPLLLQLNPDEEVGSECSRNLTEEEARKSEAVLVLEPGQDLDGKFKTARKGVGDYSLIVKGHASHAGVDFKAGASAILELSRQLLEVEKFTDLERGITVNPGVITGGTRSNVVPADARCEVDIRIARMDQAAELDRKFHALQAFDERCSIEVTGGLNRPPMERTEAIASLFARAREWAKELGIDLNEAATGGGSDGNFTAGVGVPTIDGIGAVGEGAHSPGESIRIDRIADRVALIAKLVEGI